MRLAVAIGTLFTRSDDGGKVLPEHEGSPRLCPPGTEPCEKTSLIPVENKRFYGNGEYLTGN